MKHCLLLIILFGSIANAQTPDFRILKVTQIYLGQKCKCFIFDTEDPTTKKRTNIQYWYGADEKEKLLKIKVGERVLLKNEDTLFYKKRAYPVESKLHSDTLINIVNTEFPNNLGLSQYFTGFPTEAPAPKFSRVDTTRGIVSYYNSGGRKTTKASAVDSVFIVSYWASAPFHTTLDYIPPTLKTRLDSIRFRIFTPLGDIDLNKNFEFIPNSKLQN